MLFQVVNKFCKREDSQYPFNCLFSENGMNSNTNFISAVKNYSSKVETCHILLNMLRQFLLANDIKYSVESQLEILSGEILDQFASQYKDQLQEAVVITVPELRITWESHMIIGNDLVPWLLRNDDEKIDVVIPALKKYCPNIHSILKDFEREAREHTLVRCICNVIRQLISYIIIDSSEQVRYVKETIRKLVNVSLNDLCVLSMEQAERLVFAVDSLSTHNNYLSLPDIVTSSSSDRPNFITPYPSNNLSSPESTALTNPVAGTEESPRSDSARIQTHQVTQDKESFPSNADKNLTSMPDAQPSGYPPSSLNAPTQMQTRDLNNNAAPPVGKKITIPHYVLYPINNQPLGRFAATNDRRFHSRACNQKPKPELRPVNSDPSVPPLPSFGQQTAPGNQLSMHPNHVQFLPPLPLHRLLTSTVFMATPSNNKPLSVQTSNNQHTVHHPIHHQQHRLAPPVPNQLHPSANLIHNGQTLHYSINNPKQPLSHPINNPRQPLLHPMNNPQQPLLHPINNPQHPLSHPINNQRQPLSHPINNSRQPLSHPINNPRQPLSHPINNPQQPLSHPINNPQQPLSHPMNNPQQPLFHPINNPQQPLLHPNNNPQQPLLHPINNPQQPLSHPMNNPQQPLSYPINNTRQPLSHPMNNPQQPLSHPINNPQQPLSYPINNPQQPLLHPINNPQQPLSYPMNNPQQPLSHPINNPQQPLLHPFNNPQQPLLHPINNPQQPLSYPINNPQQPLSHPINNPQQPLLHPFNNPQQPLSHPINNPQQPLSHPPNNPQQPLSHPINNPQQPLSHPINNPQQPLSHPINNPQQPLSRSNHQQLLLPPPIPKFHQSFANPVIPSSISHQQHQMPHPIHRHPLLTPHSNSTIRQHNMQQGVTRGQQQSSIFPPAVNRPFPPAANQPFPPAANQPFPPAVSRPFPPFPTTNGGRNHSRACNQKSKPEFRPETNGPLRPPSAVNSDPSVPPLPSSSRGPSSPSSPQARQQTGPQGPSSQTNLQNLRNNFQGAPLFYRRKPFTKKKAKVSKKNNK